MNLFKLVAFAGIALFLSCSGKRSDKDIQVDVSVIVHPSAPDITVSVKDGVVFLSGMVADSPHLQITLKAAKSVEGVDSVDNKLHVRTPREE